MIVKVELIIADKVITAIREVPDSMLLSVPVSQCVYDLTKEILICSLDAIKKLSDNHA